MARLIPYKELAALPSGTPVWEEWAYGTDTSRMVKTRTLCTPKGRLIIHASIGDDRGEIAFVPSREWRYWDAEPTDEERRAAPWR